jgi:uncharacterized OB-fold protein
VTHFEPVEAALLFADAPVGEVTSLLASSCPACARLSFPARTQCPGCGSDSAAVQLRGPARLRAHTAVLAQPPGAQVQAPYEVGVAEFAEGICVIGLLAGPSAIGDAVVPVVHEPYDGGRFFAFRRP